MRYEYKYFVHSSKINLLRKMISPFVELDKYTEQRKDKQYTVRSIYFDTPSFNYYFEKVEGIKHRKKFRLRGYNNEEDEGNNVVFEIKRKYEIPIVKNRAYSTYGDACRIFREFELEPYIQNNSKFPQGLDNSKRFFYHYHNRKLRPVILVIYEREAFLGSFNKTIRITFDKNLRSIAFPSIDELYSEDRARSSVKDHFILEVKFNDYYPSWMKPIVGMLSLRRGPASKYVISIDTQNIVNRKNLPNTFARTMLFKKITVK